MYFSGATPLPAFCRIRANKVWFLQGHSIEEKIKARTEFSLVRIFFLIWIYCITNFSKFNLIPSLLSVRKTERESAYISLQFLYWMKLAPFTCLLMFHTYPGYIDNTTEATLTLLLSHHTESTVELVCYMCTLDSLVVWSHWWTYMQSISY